MVAPKTRRPLILCQGAAARITRFRMLRIPFWQGACEPTASHDHCAALRIAISFRCVLSYHLPAPCTGDNTSRAFVAIEAQRSRPMSDSRESRRADLGQGRFVSESPNRSSLAGGSRTKVATLLWHQFGTRSVCEPVLTGRDTTDLASPRGFDLNSGTILVTSRGPLPARAPRSSSAEAQQLCPVAP